jgi:hypothetical protein
MQSEGRQLCTISGISLSFMVDPVWPCWPPLFFLVAEDSPLLMEDGLGLLKKSVEEGSLLLPLF